MATEGGRWSAPTAAANCSNSSRWERVAQLVGQVGGDECLGGTVGQRRGEVGQESWQVGLEVTVLGGVGGEFGDRHFSSFPAPVERMLEEAAVRQRGGDLGARVEAGHRVGA